MTKIKASWFIAALITLFTLTDAAPAVAIQEPRLVTPTKISGTAQVGQTLTATSAVWSTEGFPLEANTYSFDRCTSPSPHDCTLIPGLSWASHVYVVTADDVGSMIRVWSSLQLSEWHMASQSEPTAVVTFPPPPPPPVVVQCLTPKLKGKTLSQAKKVLARAHCTLGKVSRVKTKSQHKVVVSQKPGAGKKLPAGAKIAVKLG